METDTALVRPSVPPEIPLRRIAPRRRLTAERRRGALDLAGLESPGEVAYSSGMDGAITRITADPSVCSGQPCVRGLRITVALVLKYLAAGRTAAEVVEEFPELEVEDVRDCLRYAAWLASGRTLTLPSGA